METFFEMIFKMSTTEIFFEMILSVHNMRLSLRLFQVSTTWDFLWDYFKCPQHETFFEMIFKCPQHETFLDDFKCPQQETIFELILSVHHNMRLSLRLFQVSTTWDFLWDDF